MDGGTLSDNGKICPSNMLQCPVQVSFNYWLSWFVVEARQALEDGQPYLPTSVGLVCIVSAENMIQIARVSSAAGVYSCTSATAVEWYCAWVSACSLASVTCIVNMSPQNIVVNVNPPSEPYAPDVDSLLDALN